MSRMTPAIWEGQIFKSSPVPMNITHSPDSRGDPTVENWVFASDLGDDEDGCGWLELRIHEVIDTRKSGTLITYYRTWFNPENEPMARPYRRVASVASVRALIAKRHMKLVNP